MAKHNMAEQLKRLREERGLSQAALARDAAVGQTTITLLESGKRKGVNLETLVDIAIALSKSKPVSLDELVGYDASRYYTQADAQPVTRHEIRELQVGMEELQGGMADLTQVVRNLAAVLLPSASIQQGDRVRPIRRLPPNEAK